MQTYVVAVSVMKREMSGDLALELEKWLSFKLNEQLKMFFFKLSQLFLTKKIWKCFSYYSRWFFRLADACSAGGGEDCDGEELVGEWWFNSVLHQSAAVFEQVVVHIDDSLLKASENERESGKHT